MKHLKQYAIAGFLVVSAAVAVVIRRNKKSLYTMYYPVKGRITSPYGQRTNPITKKPEFHNGIDIASSEGTRILCPSDGTVLQLTSSESGGNQLQVKHDNGLTSGYAHASKYVVAANQRVYQGNTLGYVGRTGQVTGPHLHFTLKDEKGNYLNPVDYLT